MNTQQQFTRKYVQDLATDETIQEVARSADVPVDIGGKPEIWQKFCGTVRTRMLTLLNERSVANPQTEEDNRKLIEYALQEPESSASGQGTAQQQKRIQRFKDSE